MKNLLYTFLFSIVLLSCNLGGKSTTSQYIDSTSEGVIGVKMPIIVTLKEETNLSSAQLKGIVSISPKIEFVDTLVAGRIIKIVPNKVLDYDQSYTVSIDLKKLTSGKESGTYQFNVFTERPQYQFKTNALQTVDGSNVFSLSGVVESSDFVDSTYIENGLKVSGCDSPVAWIHSPNGMTHNYSIEPITPHKKEHEITLNFNYHTTKQSVVSVPGVGDYRILDCRVTTDPLSVEISFSHNIKPVQRFDELIKLNVPFRTRVDNNKLIIYPAEPVPRTASLKVYSDVRSVKGEKLPQPVYNFDLEFPETAPAIRFISNGTILPSSNNMKLLFESVNYAKARVRVRKIYANNLLQFFQSNDYNGDSYLEYVSAFVKDTTFNIDVSGSFKLRNRNNYALDLSPFIKGDNKAIYRVEIAGVEPLVKRDNDSSDDDDYYYYEDSYQSRYYLGDYRTYKERSINVMQSDLGLITKGDERGNFTVYSTDIISAMPLSGTVVQIYNSVNQLIGKATSDSQGKAELRLKERPHIVLAENGSNRSLLRIEPEESLSTSNFDVDGTNSQSGIKGYLFGERGVWRPGDDIYLTFMVMSNGVDLPSNHPAEISLRNPNGQRVVGAVQSTSSHGVYSFKLKTPADARTGNWTAEVKYGGEVFTKTIKIETIKPNRIRINLSLNEKPMIPADNIVAQVNAKWLHGAPASDLSVKATVRVSSTTTTFKGYEKFSFDNRARRMDTEEHEVLSGTTDSLGAVTMKGALAGLATTASGVVNAHFSVKVFEKSGDFSIDEYSTKMSPFRTYVGVQVDMESIWDLQYLNSEKQHTFNFVALNEQGKLQSGTSLKVELYKASSSWWWDSSSGAIASYMSRSHNRPYRSEFITLKDGKGSLPIKWNTEDYGFYIINVSDMKGGHATSMQFRVGDYTNEEQSEQGNAATRLVITKNKEKYSVGESAVLSIPTPKGARALVSIENGSRVLESYWTDCSEGTTTLKIPIKSGMTPNVYACITTIQPHQNTKNDLPIRMYGVVRLPIEDPATKLTPAIKIPETVRPEGEFTLTVSEQNGKAMSYVVAVVDEGLLDITRFKTPDPYAFFNANEALGIRTWDLFDKVIGAYGGRIEQLFSIGGGDDESLSPGHVKAERFKPVVHFIETQKLSARKSNTHKIKLPPYFGSVRVMVVASSGTAQGNVEKRVEVKKPLLAQLTMPRVISTDEEIEVPVTLFATQDKIGNVTVELSHNELFSVVGAKSQRVTINKAGESLIFFRLKANSKIGIGKVSVLARCSCDESSSAVEIDVRNPNPVVTQSKSLLIKPGQSTSVEGFKSGVPSSVELSVLPPIDLSGRLRYLTQYPHGCLEQIVSGAFPQLYITDILNCPEDMLAKMQNNIKSTLTRLSNYQSGGGGYGLAYWSGGSYVSNWCATYATHFMIEASKKGYVINDQLKKNCINYLRKANFSDHIDRAYALYVLALNSTPDRGAMNRLREQKGLSMDAQWLLAGAYALDGNAKTAREIIRSTVDPKEAISPFGASFNSPERRMAVMLSVYNLLGQKTDGFTLVTELSKSLSSGMWLSTQSIAWSLNAISQYATGSQKAANNSVQATVGSNRIQTDKPITETSITKAEKITNHGNDPLHVVVSTAFAPDKGAEPVFAKGLSINVDYSNLSGAQIDPSSLAAGTEFFVEVAIRNTSPKNYTNLALTHIVPAGWEIANSRLNADQSSDIANQDIRDDRVLSYFDLKSNGVQKIKIRATATYKGRYYLPAVSCEAMYDGTVAACTKGAWIEVK